MCGIARCGRGCATVMAIVQNREWKIVTLPRLRAILLRSLILREARALNRYSRRDHEDYSLYSIFPGVYATGSCPQQKFLLPYWHEVARWVVNISKRRCVMRGNYSQYNEGRSALCNNRCASVTKKKYIPFRRMPAVDKGRSEEGRVLEGPC